MVDDARGVRVLYTAKGGVARAEVVTEAVVREQVRRPPRAYADFAALRGDPSDGLPGVPGVGRQDGGGADQRVRRRSTASWRAADAGDPGVRASVHDKVVAARDYLAVAPAVVRVALDCRCPTSTTACRPRPPIRTGSRSSPTAGGSRRPCAD